MPSSRGSQRQHSARLSSLRQTTPYSRESTTSMVIDPSFDPTYFPITETRFPLGTPLTAKRSRKYYSDLDNERQFLLNLKEQWEKKLENLQEDHRFLTRMGNLTKEEVADVAPLFTRSIEEQEEPATSELHESPIAMPAAPSFQLPESPLELGYPSSLPPRPAENLLDMESMGSSYIANGQIEITDPETLTALEKLEELFKSNQANEDRDLEQNEEDEEDEEKARLALNLMLRQFGDSL